VERELVGRLGELDAIIRGIVLDTSAQQLLDWRRIRLADKGAMDDPSLLSSSERFFKGLDDDGVDCNDSRELADMVTLLL
jgi:hypothetical protein